MRAAYGLPQPASHDLEGARMIRFRRTLRLAPAALFLGSFAAAGCTGEAEPVELLPARPLTAVQGDFAELKASGKSYAEMDVASRARYDELAAERDRALGMPQSLDELAP